MPDGGAVTARLFLVRHGQVHNPRELAYGHLPRFGLDPQGREQAERTAAWLSNCGVAALYTSPLLRARQTAAIIRARLGDVPLHTTRLLRESELARFWQGLPWRDIATVHAELFATFETTPSRVTTGEPLTAMARRMRFACLRAARRYPAAAIALVSHRDPILALRLEVEQRSHDELNHTACRPGSVTELVLEGQRLTFCQYVEP